ncbi:heavy metal translocating P-type ATPase [Arundinibacter roseus]|uniref:HAD family hydrolase n=1 Tax=Arundinibacter roseus TaxID=2070510 RepID=A0A4R4K1R6_9BACT|nr:heavy metal translocating P-type ATPase metal-binding domain-containing protein [Arundinibacter roseus]TDB61113.1 HAD family hydrolase [Arundinibacter roseus]
MGKNEPALAIHPPVQPAACYHCGESCQEEHHRHDDHDFCCEGCKTVYDLLKENDLCQYYRLGDSQGNSPSDDFYQGKFDHLNLDDVRSKLLEFTDGKQARVNWLVPKMHCSSCIWLLEQLHRLHPAVGSSVVNFPEKTVRITFHPDRIKLSELAELMSRIGYEPYISLNDVEGKQVNKWNRTRLYKMGIAGFTFGNIMMLSLPEYFDLGQSQEDQQLRWLFTGLNVALSLPVIFYSASEFFVSAWKALRGRYLNIDAPIALALLSVFLTSLYQVFSQTGPGYFDSLAGAVFFMLLGRYFQDKTYAGIAFDRDYKSYFPIAVAVMKEGVETRLPVNDLRPGDHILIRNRELIPADATLLSPIALIDYSFVSGEADAVERRKGDVLYAGGRQCGPAVEMEVVRRVSQSYLTQLWNNDAFTHQKEDQNTTLASRINRYFSSVVLVLAAVTFLVWAYMGSWETAFNASTTLLLVACPCALLLSTTFTNGNLLSLFGKHGFYIKNAFAIERLSKIDTVVFDKTGTMTLSNEAEVQFIGSTLSTDEKLIIKTLAGQSSHSLSRLIVKSLAESSTSRKAFTQFEEQEGAGLRAVWGRQVVRMGSKAWVMEGGAVPVEELEPGTRNPRVYVAFNGESRGYFDVKPRYRPGLTDSVKTLQKEGFGTYLLSGDQPTDQVFLGSVFGTADQLLFQRKPEQKLAFVDDLQQKHKTVLMVGDGLNDAGALQQSDVGLAVSDDINTFSPACDAILQGEKLPLLPNYIRLAQAGQRIIKSSFALSLLYNLVGISFAITGQLSPVVAAILMPISSISIVLFTTLTTNQAAKKWMH